MSAIPTITKEEPHRACSATNGGVRSFQQRHVSATRTRNLKPTEHDAPTFVVRRLGHGGKCGHTTPAGTCTSNGDPDGPRGCSPDEGHTRSDREHSEYAHHAGVSIPVHEA